MTSEVVNDFIGREREINWLKAAWAQTRQGKAQICVLRGESGFGKTRIVQAFYSWLSSDREQDPQGYWPDVLLKDGNNLRLNPPPASFGETKTLPWLWWGARWRDPGDQNLSELSTCALIDGLHHLEPHREALLARREKLKRTGMVAAELGTVAGELLSFGILGAGKSLVELIQYWREDRQIQEREELNVEERQASALQAQIDGLYEFFRFVLEPSVVNSGSLPLILVLDDAHWMDTRSLDLVERLLKSARLHRWPLMIVVTHWEQDWNTQAQDAKRDSFPALFTHLAADPAKTEEASLSMEICNIDRLDGLEQLLYEGLPGLTEEQIAFVCSRADGNPRLMNEIILELLGEPLYFEQEDTQGPLSEEALTRLSQMNFALHEVQKRRFRRFDEALRKILGYASYQGMRFLPQLVLDVAQLLDADHAPEDDADRLSHAVHPYAVLAAESAVIYEFRHRVFHDLAKERISLLPQLESSISKTLLQTADEWLQQGKLALLAPAEHEIFYRLMLEQRELTNAAYPHLGLRLITGLFRLYRDTGRFVNARDWSERLVNELPADGRISTEILPPKEQRSIAYVLLELDLQVPSEILARGVVETCSARLAQSDISAEHLGDIAAAEVCLGDVLRRADQIEEARQFYEQSLATSERVVSEFGETAERLRGLSVSQVKVGDILLKADQPEKARQFYEQSLANSERVVTEFGETAERLRDVSVLQNKVGDVLLSADQIVQARQLYEKALATSERILTGFGETAEQLRDLSVSQIKVGDVLRRDDQPTQALELYEKSLATFERIVTEFGETAGRLSDVSACQNRAGDVLRDTDQLMQARELYEKALATSERVVTEFGETAERLRDVSTSQERIGDVLMGTDQPAQARELYEKALAIRERILTEFGETAERLSDISYAQTRIGDVLLRTDQPEQARELYEKSLAICERIVTEFGETSDRLRNVSSARINVGDVLLGADQPEQALKHYEESLVTFKHIVTMFGETANRLRDLSGTQNRIGNVLWSASQPEQARELYEESLATFKRIVIEYGETAQRLSDVSRLQERVGEVLLGADQPEHARELHESSLAICERLVTEFGETAERLIDISNAETRIGDVLLRTDQTEQAHEFYEKSLATSERVVTEFGETAERLRNVSSSQKKVGDMLLHANQPEQARELYEKSLVTCERLVTEFSVTAERLRDLLVAKIKVGDVLLRADQLEQARELYEESLVTGERLVKEFGETADRLRNVSVSQNKIGEVLLRTDQPEKAHAFYEKSFATFEHIVTEFGETTERLRDVAVSLIKLADLAHQTGKLVLAREQLEASELLLARLAENLGTASGKADLDHVRALIIELEKTGDAEEQP